MAEIELKISNLPVPYNEAVTEMEARVQSIHEGCAGELIWLLQHPSLYTAGTSNIHAVRTKKPIPSSQTRTLAWHNKNARRPVRKIPRQPYDQRDLVHSACRAVLHRNRTTQVEEDRSPALQIKGKCTRKEQLQKLR